MLEGAEAGGWRLPPAATVGQQPEQQQQQQQQQQPPQEEQHAPPGPVGEAREEDNDGADERAWGGGGAADEAAAAAVAAEEAPDDALQGPEAGDDDAEPPPGSSLGSFVDDDDADGTGAAAASGAPPGGRRAPRRGVLVALLAEGVAVVGEKGSKVPNVSIREIALEVEAAFSAVFEFDPAVGAWAAPPRGGVSFEVLSLERRAVGASVPLPKALIKSLLNLVLPPVRRRCVPLSAFTLCATHVIPRKTPALQPNSNPTCLTQHHKHQHKTPTITKKQVFLRLALAALPRELGRYVAASGRGVSASAELRVTGPSLAAMAADLSLGACDAPRSRSGGGGFGSGTGGGGGDLAAFARERRAAQRARAMLGVADDAAWRAAAPLFRPGASCLLPASDARPGPLTAAELCRILATYGQSPAWPSICAAWQPALAAAAAAAPAPPGAPPPRPLDVAALMAGAVAAVARKPVRVAVEVGRLEAAAEAGAALEAARDYFERLARGFAEGAKG